MTFTRHLQSPPILLQVCVRDPLLWQLHMNVSLVNSEVSVTKASEQNPSGGGRLGKPVRVSTQERLNFEVSSVRFGEISSCRE